MKAALGYIRVSSEEQAASGLGLTAQRPRIADYSEPSVVCQSTVNGRDLCEGQDRPSSLLGERRPSPNEANQLRGQVSLIASSGARAPGRLAEIPSKRRHVRLLAGVVQA